MMLSLLSFVFFAVLNGLSNSTSLSHTPAIHQIYQFPNHTFVENIATRPNGHLLLTTLSEPALWKLDPTESNPVAELVHSFPFATGLTGIAEIGPDVFAVVSGNWTLETMSGTLGSFAVWSVDMRLDPPVLQQIATIPDTANLNGITTVPGSPNLILLADSALGAVWSLEISTGKSQIVIQDPLFESSSSFPLGINGVLAHQDNNLYFTNSAQGIFGRVPITSEGVANGEVEVLSHVEEGSAWDDFDIDREGNAWISAHPKSVTKVSLSENWTQTVFGGKDNATLADPTSASFGRGSKKEERTLYVSTGGLTYLVDGKVFGGQVVAIDTWMT